MKYKPLGAWTLVKPEAEQDKKTKTGLVIQQSSEVTLATKQGTVIAHGTGVRLSDGTLSRFSTEIGDRIVYKDFAGIKIMLDDEEYVQLLDMDILGKMINNENYRI